MVKQVMKQTVEVVGVAIMGVTEVEVVDEELKVDDEEEEVDEEVVEEVEEVEDVLGVGDLLVLVGDGWVLVEAGLSINHPRRSEVEHEAHIA